MDMDMDMLAEHAGRTWTRWHDMNMLARHEHAGATWTCWQDMDMLAGYVNSLSDGFHWISEKHFLSFALPWLYDLFHKTRGELE